MHVKISELITKNTRGIFSVRGNEMWNKKKEPKIREMNMEKVHEAK